jgi:hypothetical protein
MAKAKVPSTISDKEWQGMKRRARRAEARSGGMFTAAATRHRKATTKQRGKAAFS